MSQCVPNWELDDGVLRPGHPAASASASDVPMLDYEMAELTWENGQLSMHGLGLRRVSSTSKCAWERPRATSGTLESIVAPCFGGGKAVADALVPCEEERRRRPEEEGSSVPKKKARCEGSVSGTGGLTDSWHVPTVDTCEKGNTVSSSGLPASTANDDHDSVCHSRPPQSETGEEQDTKRSAKSSSSTRRSRAAAIHNQSERKRRDKINQKMKTLQKLVPNSNKTDKASMLDEVIDYLKQLQAQVQMMSRMSVSPAAAAAMNMMMPQLAMQQQLHMSMMAAAASPMGMGMSMGMSMGMGMGMGMGALGMGMGALGMTSMPPAMDINPMARQNQMAASFMPLADRQSATTVIPTDPISSYLACQPQPMTIEAYSRMIALIQQQQQQLASLSKH